MLDNKLNNLNVTLYEYIYAFMMVIYMSFMTPETRVMNGGILTRTLAFLIPIILTFCLIHNYSGKIKWSLYFGCLLLPLILWTIIQVLVKYTLEAKVVINYIYMIYAAIIAVVHLEIYGKRIFPLYEDIIVFLAKISLFTWFFTLIAPPIAMSVARLFPETGSGGHNFFYLVNWMDINGRHVQGGLIRNSGSSWEPGRFAIMLCLGLLFNLYRKGLTFHDNRNIIILLLTVVTTFSTTGYILASVIIVYFYVQNFTIPNIIKMLIVVVPIGFVLSQLDFIGEKLNEKTDMTTQVEHIKESYGWTEIHNENEGTAYAMDRFPSMYFEFENFLHDPLLGYGPNRENSFFYNNYTDAIGFCGGLAQLFSVHGLFLGLLFTIILFRSSIRINALYRGNKPYGFFIYTIISMISYPIIWFPVFTAFWFYSLSGNFDEDNSGFIDSF